MAMMRLAAGPRWGAAWYLIGFPGLQACAVLVRRRHVKKQVKPHHYNAKRHQGDGRPRPGGQGAHRRKEQTGIVEFQHGDSGRLMGKKQKNERFWS